MDNKENGLLPQVIYEPLNGRKAKPHEKVVVCVELSLTQPPHNGVTVSIPVIQTDEFLTAIAQVNVDDVTDIDLKYAEMAYANIVNIALSHPKQSEGVGDKEKSLKTGLMSILITHPQCEYLSGMIVDYLKSQGPLTAQPNAVDGEFDAMCDDIDLIPKEVIAEAWEAFEDDHARAPSMKQRSVIKAVFRAFRTYRELTRAEAGQKGVGDGK